MDDHCAPGHALRHTIAFHTTEPLWQRAPTRDEQGRPLPDFMMLIPRLGTRPARQVRTTLQAIAEVLHQYRDAVVFADMNLRINVLWVTVRPVPGICLELPAALKVRVPEAMLVAHRAG
ncbi:hypothetical protein B1C78_17135 [Thioalkalivibrio denitrificans]|uniref:Uncharacterized protein n=1 Tax=Thioalkalivibrio denitrificans TaxID=108003 RepID=A0A1V3N745_9GAMM|nr:hypothetical protein [Thioalkalivibrio denitrificans]OOG20616.1 hypothetical protein B1C78_17135 [Thioalkalivibrio denitrificans]